MKHNSNIILHKLSLDKNQDKKKIYNIWADTYEDYVKQLKYEGPQSLVLVLNKYINDLNYKVLNILDFGCGTGLLGEELKKNIIQQFELDGIDISPKMIEKSKEKYIYNNLWNLNIEDNNKINKKYNIIVSSGVFLEGHASLKLINNLIDLLEKNGLLFITIRESYINSNSNDYNTYIKNNNKIRLTDNIKINYLPGVMCNLIIATKL